MNLLNDKVEPNTRPLKPSSDVDNVDPVESKRFKKGSTSLQTNLIQPHELALRAIRKQQARAFEQMKRHLEPSLLLTDLNEGFIDERLGSQSVCSTDDMTEYFIWGANRCTIPSRKLSLRGYNQDDDDLENQTQSSLSSLTRDLRRLDDIFGRLIPGFELNLPSPFASSSFNQQEGARKSTIPSLGLSTIEAIDDNDGGSLDKMIQTTSPSSLIEASSEDLDGEEGQPPKAGSVNNPAGRE